MAYPIEVKKTANPGKGDIAAFGALSALPEVKRAAVVVVCFYDKLAALKGDDVIIPVTYI